MPITKSNNVITYTAPDNLSLLQQTGCLQDNDFAVVAKDDDIKQVKFSVGGTSNTSSTLAFAPTASRTVAFPDMAGTVNVVEALQYSTPIAADTVTMTASNLVIEPAGTLATLTVVLPVGSYDGQIVRIATTKQLTGLTINAGGSDTIVNAVTTLAANASTSYIYRLSSTKWYRLL